MQDHATAQRPAGVEARSGGGGPADSFAGWVGRSQDAHDVVDAVRLDRLAATLGREDPPLHAGDTALPLSHWCHFLPLTPAAETGPDGHALRGGFLPDLADLPRRMWAGSRIAFPGDLKVGVAIRRRSAITAARPRQGRSGPLLFVTLRHEVQVAATTEVVLVEEQDIVYRGPDDGASREAPRPAPAAAGEPQPASVWRRELLPDPVLLFRYSALTFNSHRIHYDQAYARDVEGYPDLVVHGPLTATLLLDLVSRSDPSLRIRRFDFRAVSPLFAGQPLGVHGVPPDREGRIVLWAAGPGGRLAMQGEAFVS